MTLVPPWSQPQRQMKARRLTPVGIIELSSRASRRLCRYSFNLHGLRIMAGFQCCHFVQQSFITRQSLGFAVFLGNSRKNSNISSKVLHTDIPDICKFLHIHILSHENFTLWKNVNLWQNCPVTKQRKSPPQTYISNWTNHEMHGKAFRASNILLSVKFYTECNITHWV